MPRKKKPHAATTRYAALKAKWETRCNDPAFKGAGDWLIAKPELSLDATPINRFAIRLALHRTSDEMRV